MFTFITVLGIAAVLGYLLYRRYGTVHGRIETWKQSVADRLPSKRGPIIVEAGNWATQTLQKLADAIAGQIAVEDRKNKQARDEALAPIRSALEKVNSVSSSCTDLFTHIALLDRISQVNDIDWIASDLAQTCTTATKPINPRHQVVFGVLPGAGYEGRAENRAIAKAADFVTEFPNSTYLLPAEMMAEAWWKKGVQK